MSNATLVEIVGGATPSGAVGAAVVSSAPSNSNGDIKPIYEDTHGGLRVLIQDSSGNPLDYTTTTPVAPQKVIGQTTWTKTAFTLNGSSQTLLSANAARVGVVVFNRVGNSQVDVDFAGGTVAANTGEPILAGNGVSIEGAYCPVGAITVIGTNAQLVNVWELT